MKKERIYGFWNESGNCTLVVASSKKAVADFYGTDKVQFWGYVTRRTEGLYSSLPRL